MGQRRMSEIVIAMRPCPQPIVALVDGRQAGADLRWRSRRISASRTAHEDERSLHSHWSVRLHIGVSYFLPRMVGSAVAAEYLLTGRFVDAETALALRLVSRLVDPEEIVAAGDEIVADMLRATPLGLRLTKDALNHAIDAGSLERPWSPWRIAIRHCARQDPDFAEGLTSFLEKRDPVYRGLWLNDG